MSLISSERFKRPLWALFLLLLLVGISLAVCSLQADPAVIPPTETAIAAQAATATLQTEPSATPTTRMATSTPTSAPIEQTATRPLPTSIYSAAQLAQLQSAAAAYISPDTESANQTVKDMNYAAGADASLTCGPLAIAILQDASLLSPYLPLNDFWLSSPLPGRNEPIFKEAFPQSDYEWKRDTTPMAEMDFSADPLLPGDFVYTFGGNYEHMFTVTRVDETGRAYTVQNLEQGYLNDDLDDFSFVIVETLLYDPAVPGAGMVYEWADPENWKLGHTGTKGYMRFRRSVPLEESTDAQEQLARQLDEVIDATGGKWNILIESLEGETIYARRPDEIIHPASTIKVAIAMMTFEFLDQFGEGTLEERLQRGPVYNILENDRSYAQLLHSMLVFSEEASADILYENIHESPLNEYTLLAEWGLTATNLEPRKSTAREMNSLYRGLYQGSWTDAEQRQMILDWLAVYTPNDDLRLGQMNTLSDEKLLPYNKRGSLVAPLLIVADTGIAVVGDQVYLLQFFAYHDELRPTTYEALEAALGEMGMIVGAWLLDQSELSP